MRVLCALRDERGFTFIGAIFLVVVVGIGLSVTGVAWSTISKREKETELLFRGIEIAKGIGRYYNDSPGTKRYPKSLGDLADDKRFPVIKRHVRRIYKDPMTGRADWVIIKAPTGGIMGVKSASKDIPFKTGGFSPEELIVVKEGASSYSEWEFKYTAKAIKEVKKEDEGVGGLPKLPKL